MLAQKDTYTHTNNIGTQQPIPSHMHLLNSSLACCLCLIHSQFPADFEDNGCLDSKCWSAQRVDKSVFVLVGAVSLIYLIDLGTKGDTVKGRI